MQRRHLFPIVFAVCMLALMAAMPSTALAAENPPGVITEVINAV